MKHLSCFSRNTNTPNILIIFMLRIDTGLLGSISSPRPRLLVALSPLASSYVTITPINTAHLWQLPSGSASTTILGSIRSSLVSCKSLPATICILTPKTCMETKKSSNCAHNYTSTQVCARRSRRRLGRPNKGETEIDRADKRRTQARLSCVTFETTGDCSRSANC